jgi:T5SS/PEP-CTERM-associated repeat protein
LGQFGINQKKIKRRGIMLKKIDKSVVRAELRFANRCYENFSGYGLSLLLILSLFCPLLSYGAIVPNGDIAPENPTTWTAVTHAYIGKTTSGTLTINGGSDIQAYYAYLARDSASSALVTVDGTGSTSISTGLEIGYSGNGTLSVLNGGSVNTDYCNIGNYSGSQGSLLVDQANSTFLSSNNFNIGREGSGSMEITNGGMVQSVDDASIGRSSGSTGNVIVSSINSTWTNAADLYVGKFGGGTMSISGSGQVSGIDTFIGRYTGATGLVSVDGAGSILTSNSLHIGSDGSGTLNITNGGHVNIQADTWARRYSGTSAEIHFENGTLTTGSLLCATDDITGIGTINTNGIVSDVDLVFNAGSGLNQTVNIDENIGQNVTVNLSVEGSGNMGAGFGSSGTMSISDGLAVSSTGGYIGYKTGSTGTVTVNGSGSSWSNSETLYVGHSGQGELSIINGGNVLSTGSSYLGRYSGSKGIATIEGSESTWINNSGLHVGVDGGGTLNIVDEGLVCIGGFLTIDEDDNGDSFVNIANGGKLAIFGQAEDSLESFLALTNRTDGIRYWNYSLGQWDDINAATLGADFELFYIPSGELAGYTLLAVTETFLLEGDANRDGVVSAGDYATVQSNFGNTGIAGILGDANGDGVVSAGDYASVQANFGQVAPAGNQVPEPTAVSLLIGGTIAICRFKRNNVLTGAN